jgi:hypothetical protein
MREFLRRASLGSQTRSIAFGDPVPARRLFITRMLRAASLAVLGLAGGAVVMKRRKLLREGKCFNQGVCRDCVVYEECGLPRALSVRDVLARIRYGR